MQDYVIAPCQKAHLKEYARIYAAAFSGEPWHDAWEPEAAEVHIREMMENARAYGLEYRFGEEIAGFLLGSSMLFHYGRVFEINDIAVLPQYQGQGIGSRLLEACISDMKQRGMAGIHLITQAEGSLPAFYRKYGFKRETQVMLMGMELETDE